MDCKMQEFNKCYIDNCKFNVVFIVHDEYDILLCLSHFSTYKLDGLHFTNLYDHTIKIKQHKTRKINISDMCKQIHKYKNGTEKQCNKKALYGIKGMHSEFCFKHKHQEHIKYPDSNKCLADNCNNLALYGPPKQPALFCEEHKLENMTKTGRFIRCDYPGCKHRASYNFKDHSPKFCKDHKNDGMINLYI